MICKLRYHPLILVYQVVLLVQWEDKEHVIFPPRGAFNKDAISIVDGGSVEWTFEMNVVSCPLGIILMGTNNDRGRLYSCSSFPRYFYLGEY